MGGMHIRHCSSASRAQEGQLKLEARFANPRYWLSVSFSLLFFSFRVTKRRNKSAAHPLLPVRRDSYGMESSFPQDRPPPRGLTSGLPLYPPVTFSCPPHLFFICLNSFSTFTLLILRSLLLPASFIFVPSCHKLAAFQAHP